MIDWHTSLLILAVLLGLGILWAFWDALTSALFAGVALVVVRCIVWLRDRIR